jgi:hypothetical protein
MGAMCRDLHHAEEEGPSSGKSTNTAQKEFTTKRGLRLVKAVKRPPVARPTGDSLAEARTFEERAVILRDLQIKPIMIRHPQAVLALESGQQKITGIRLVPSDPDFCYDLETLNLTLHLNHFPSKRDLECKILNNEIPVALRILIEK